MVDMLKGNKEQMRAIYKAQGMDMSDEQLEAMANMMSPEMLKSASQMLAANPDLINQAPPVANQSFPSPPARQSSAEEVKAPTTPPLPPNMAEMMNSPMVQQMMSNPDFMKQAMSMMGGGGMPDPSKM
jgi:hypothetical protein